MELVVAGERIHISAVAFKEGDAWIAQGIEYDIVAQADDILSLPKAFMRAVTENLCITEHLGRKPLEGIGAAPAKFRDMFASAPLEMRTLNEEPTGTDLALRVMDEAA